LHFPEKNFARLKKVDYLEALELAEQCRQTGIKATMAR
jgi:hypothetical protein